MKGAPKLPKPWHGGVTGCYCRVCQILRRRKVEARRRRKPMRVSLLILLQLRGVQPVTVREFCERARSGVNRPLPGQMWGAGGNLGRARRAGLVRRDEAGRYSLTKKGEVLVARHHGPRWKSLHRSARGGVR